MRWDFGGYATRNDLRCSDGRTIRKNAFKECDGKSVPMVWMHDHKDPTNVIGHCLLENREDGVYCYGKFNETDTGMHAKASVNNGDITGLSIYANNLKQNGGDVLHGSIKEVSLVLAGANPGAYIQELTLEHSDEIIKDEAVLFTGEDISIDLEHADGCAAPKKEEKKPEAETPEDDKKEEKPVAETKERTVQDVIDTMNEEQKTVLYGLFGEALQGKGGEMKQSDENDYEEEETLKHNVFDQQEEARGNVLSHADMESIFADAKRSGSLKESVLAHAEDYGVDPIDYLFPDAKNYTTQPEFIKRKTDWVAKVMSGVHHTPFSRIKTMFADITEDEARARGYIKGNRKKEEVFTLLKRTTTPTTIYKKQKLDRDDIVDITDFDVVSWIKSEMRGQLDEEIARAILVGDGRSTASDDKINESNIRPIWTDDSLFTIQAGVNVSGTDNDSARAKAFIKACIKSRKEYKGSGNPVLFTTEDMLTNMLLIEDGIGHFLYESEEKLKTALRVSQIVTVEAMENLSRVVSSKTRLLCGIIVNLNDYNVGADKGGAINLFDDFDIDYNQQKYLIETRCSGALVKPYSAIVVEMIVNAVFGVAATAGTTTRYGKTVSSLQDGIIINDHGIVGSLNYVTGYTGYSGEVSEQSGNYLALDFTVPNGATLTGQLVGGSGNVATISDGYAVIRVTSKHQKVKLVCTCSDGEVIEKIYDLSGLELKKA